MPKLLHDVHLAVELPIRRIVLPKLPLAELLGGEDFAVALGCDLVYRRKGTFSDGPNVVVLGTARPGLGEATSGAGFRPWGCLDRKAGSTTLDDGRPRSLVDLSNLRIRQSVRWISDILPTLASFNIRASGLTWGTHRWRPFGAVAICFHLSGGEGSLLGFTLDQVEKPTQPPLVGVFMTITSRYSEDEHDIIPRGLGRANQADGRASQQHPRCLDWTRRDLCGPLRRNPAKDGAVDNGAIGRGILKHENAIWGDVDSEMHIADAGHGVPLT